MISPDRTLRLRLLGEIALLRGEEPLVLPASKKTRALLAYLAATGKAHRRDRLCTLFWDIPDDPRGSLRWSLSRLRPLLDEAEHTRIVADRDSVALAVDRLAVDLHAVERTLAQQAPGVDDLIAAEMLFSGDFAEGLELSNCEDFQAWLITQREAARQLHLRLLRQLVEHLPPEEALAYARRQVAIDPDVMPHHAVLLHLLIALGQRREAEQQAELSLSRMTPIDPAAGEALAALWRKLKASPATGPATLPAFERDPGQGDPGPSGMGWPEERKQVTVLHASLRGTNLADDPEAAADRVGPLLARMTAAIERYGGVTSLRRPDGVTALFGAPIACQNHTARACLAALAMKDTCADTAIGIALHAGELLVRLNGDQVEAFGPALSLAQEIDRASPTPDIYIERHSYLPVEGMFTAEPKNALSLPGLTEPIELLTLTGQAQISSGWYARVIRGLTDFVGRQHELFSLLRVAEKVRAGLGQVAVVVGEPGLGKSRLVHELRQNAAFCPADWGCLAAGATPYDQDTPYFVVGRLLRNWLNVGPRVAGQDVLDRLRQALQELGPGFPEFESALSVPLDLAPDPAWQALDAGLRRRQVIDAVDRVVAALAQRRPLLLVVEDLHWADADSAIIIEALVDRLARRAVCLIVTTRPEGAPSWLAKSVCQPVRLDTLDSAAAREMTDALLGEDAALENLKRRLVDRTGGTPLFLEETVTALVEAGILTGKRGGYRLERPEGDLRLPATVQAVLGERIDRLSPPLKLLLQVAAVLGDDLPLEILLPLMELEPLQLDAQLEALQAAEFLYETQPGPNRRFAFKHALTRDVAYASLLLAQRRKLHRRVLKIVLLKLRLRGEEMVERLAHHAVNAERWSLAVKFLRQAGDKSVRRSAYREAVRFYDAAVNILSQFPGRATARDLAVELRLRLRPPLGAIASFDRAFEHLRLAEQAVEQRRDKRRLVPIAIHKSYVLSSQGKIEDSLVSAQRARELAATAGDYLARLEADLAYGQACAFRGDIVGTLRTVEPIRARLTGELRHARLGQTGLRSVWCLMHLADAMTLKGDLAEARRITREAIIIAEEVNKPYDKAVAHVREGFIELEAENYHRAVAAFDRSRALAEGSDLAWVAAWARTGLGYAYLMSGHVEAGRHLLEATQRQARAESFIAVETYCTVYLADSMRRQGQWRDAGSEAAAALALARRWGYWDIEVMALLCLGEIALGRRDRDDLALSPLQEAASLAEARGYNLVLARINRLIAPILERAGEAEAAAAATLLADRLLRALQEPQSSAQPASDARGAEPTGR